MPVTTLSDAQKKLKPVLKKMNQESEDLEMDQREHMVLCDKSVEIIMGPDPIPSLDIEMDAIEDKLQRKMVEEL
jgi:hypothetical protein